MQKILVAGSTGYLGRYIVRELLARGLDFLALARNPHKLAPTGLPPGRIVEAQVTEPASLAGCCAGVDVVISTVGIPRQRDGLTYMDVDYQANRNLLDEALRSGVRKFVYVAVLRGEELTQLQICAAKERFVRELQQSGIDYCVVRPSGFFSDLREFYAMARQGRCYLFGDGTTRLNPIHGADLAEVCVAAARGPAREIAVGGPETLSHQEIAEAAFTVLQRRPKITYLPDWVRRSLLRLGRLFLGRARYGPWEFFLTAMALDMTAPAYGRRSLRSFFAGLRAEGQPASGRPERAPQ
jgi:uncharacterized protein YbjT (DUF2867 family)